MEGLPDGMGRRFASRNTGATEIPGVGVAGNTTDLSARAGASASAWAPAGSHINAVPATADTDAALTTAQGDTAIA